MTEEHHLRTRLEKLEAEIAFLRQCERLNKEVDETLEAAMRDRMPLERAVRVLLPILLQHTGASAARIHTYDEDLQLRNFDYPDGIEPEAGVANVDAELDVAGEAFGRVTLRYDRELDASEHEQNLELLLVWCEELDNFLAAIARARQKHDIIKTLSEALMHPVLDLGILEAIDALRKSIGFKDMVLVFCHEEDRAGETLSFKVVRDGEVICDSAHPKDTELEQLVRDRATAVLAGGEDDLAATLGLEHVQQQVLINGVKDRRVIGRLLVTSRTDEFSTFERDLLQQFADFLRQRIVDFNREYKHLSHCFPQPVVTRLLAEEEYHERHLQPRVKDVAIMYCDIAGFTRVSEQILKDPVLIGRLVDAWSDKVVQAIWDSGGVFDKMVGDCIIGLWGPPFFEMTPRQACHHALRTARRIREETRALVTTEESLGLADAGVELGVATGLHYAPLCVGLFGPNEDYTGFSSGMNNTSRLQGVATKDEILCMSDFVEAYQDLESFGPERTATVKNVETPIRFRPAR